MRKASTWRNLLGAVLVGLVLSRAGCSALQASADRRIADNPETYSTGSIPTPETFGIIGLFLAMILMSVAAVILLGLWLAARYKSRRPGADSAIGPR